MNIYEKFVKKDSILYNLIKKKHKFNLVVIDDDEFITNAISLMLSDHKCLNLFCFNKIDKVLDTISKHNIDLVIIDYLIDDTTGIDMILKIHQIDENIPCILITGYNTLDIVINAINSNSVYKFFLKPWKNNELIQAIYDGIEYKILKQIGKEYQDEIEVKNIILEEVNSRFESIIMNISDGVLILFPDGKINLISKRASFILNKIDNNIKIGLSIFDTKIDDILKQKIFYFINNKDSDIEKFEYKIFENIYSIHISKFFNNSGKVLGIIVIFIDITKEKELDKMKSDFVSNVSHELKTPLSSIQGFSEILLNNNDFPEEKKKEFLKIILNESIRLSDMVNSILNISKIESLNQKPNIETINLFLLIKEIIIMLNIKAEKKFIELVYDFEPENKEIKSNKSMLKEILLNLIDNAIKYSNKYKKVFIKVFYVNDILNISIKDQGVGIPEEELENIFKKFYRLNNSSERGTGLGLSIVKALADRLNIEIKVSSKVGIGSEFLLIFK